jgi:hypothetical protein
LGTYHHFACPIFVGIAGIHNLLQHSIVIMAASTAAAATTTTAAAIAGRRHHSPALYVDVEVSEGGGVSRMCGSEQEQMRAASHLKEADQMCLSARR